MKKSITRFIPHFILLFALFSPFSLTAQIDTLAFQDFEVMPQAPVWTYSGTPNNFLAGISGSNATPANSPLGIDSSRAWHTAAVPGGNPVVFDNQIIPAIYDSIRVRFRLAAMNLGGSSGGPDNLDYVLVAYSTDGGNSFVDRLRVRGAVNNNCSWPYSASSIAKAYYLPANEVVFQPQNSGLQLTDGLGTVELVFPGSISQLSIRITPRSSVSSDNWLIDNLVLEGIKTCSATTSSLTATACGSYTSPSGNIWTTSNVYQDTIMNASGCDSILTINLTVNNNSSDTLAQTVCGSYTSPSGKIFTTSNTYLDTIPSSNGCDSLLTINLTVNVNSSDTLNETACESYTSPSGKVFTTSNTYLDTIPNGNGCDSLLTINLTINTTDTAVTVSGNTLQAQAVGATYQWIDCSNNSPITGATNASFTPIANGSYAVIVTENGCTDTSSCYLMTVVGIAQGVADNIRLWPNPTQKSLHLELPNFVEGAQLSIFDLRGQQLLQQALSASKAHTVAVDGLSPGIYFVEISVNGEKHRLKFLKE